MSKLSKPFIENMNLKSYENVFDMKKQPNRLKANCLDPSGKVVTSPNNVLIQFEKFNKLLNSNIASKYKSSDITSCDKFFNKFYKPINLHLDNDFNKYDSLILTAYQKYLYTFAFCTSYATRNTAKILTFNNKDFSTRSFSSLENSMRLTMSSIHHYIFPPRPSVYYRHISSPDKYYKEQVIYKKAWTSYYDKLYDVSYSLLLSIKDYPFSAFIPMTEPTKFNNFDDSFKANLEKIRQSPTILMALQPYILENFHRFVLPLDFMNQYIYNQDNILNKNNPTFTPTRVKRFYKNYYSTFTKISDHNINPRRVLFNSFISEWLLNGTFIIHSWNLFSLHRTVNMQKELPHVALTLFHSLNSIENFFLRRVLIDFFVESYYSSYSYNNEHYEKGKVNPEKWIHNITNKIIPDLAKDTRKVLFAFCSATLSQTSPYIEINDIYKYFNLQSVDDMPKHRTKIADQLILDFTSDYYLNFLAPSGNLLITHLSPSDIING